MTDDKLYDEATKVTAEDGEVILDGPDSVDVRITPEAAEKTADNLLDGAVEAAGQRRFKGLDHKPSAPTPDAKTARQTEACRAVPSLAALIVAPSTRSRTQERALNRGC